MVTMLFPKITRRISAIAFALACVVVSFAPSSLALAQTTQTSSPPPQQPQPPQPQEGADDDPTRAVFFSVREEYRNLRNGAWNNRIILRKDAAVLRGKPGIRRGFLLRADLPITTTHLGSGTQTGLGDLYGQALYIPYISRKFAFVTGTGIVFPTATDKTLGAGKWQVAPMAVPVWFLPRAKGFFYVKVQDFISVAGVGDRQEIHFLLITPTFTYRPARRWWVLADLDSRTNWKNDNRTDFRVGFQVGRVISRRFGLAVKPEIPLGGTRPGDWTLKVSGIWYQ